MRRKPVRSFLFVLAVAATALALPALASAATIVVNTTQDVAPSGGECEGGAGCSLRQAVDYANNHTGTTVEMPAGHYRLTIPPEGVDSNNSGDLNVGPAGISLFGAGARKTTIDANSLGDRVFKLNPGGTTLMGSLTITGGHLEEEEGESGAGISAREAQLILVNAAVSGNVTSGENDAAGIAGLGSQLFLIASTVSNNFSEIDGGGVSAYKGSQLIVTNSTIANNTVETAPNPSYNQQDAFGAGIETFKAEVEVGFSTIFGNKVIDHNDPELGGGAALYGDLSNTEIGNTIIAGNTSSGTEFSGKCVGTTGTAALSLGHNLESAVPSGEERCVDAGSDRIADPLLAPLANYGGETDTMALYETSPAIDHADREECPEADQRGEPRPVGAGCDIGAWEGKGLPLPPKPATTPVVAPPAPKRVPHATISKKGKVVVKAAGKSFIVKTGITVSCAAGADCPVALKATAKPPKTGGAGQSAKAKPPVIGRTILTVKAGKSQGLSFRLSTKGAKLLNEAGKLGAKFEVMAATSTAKKAAALKLPLPKPER